MRKEYELSKLTVKRRGPLPAFQGSERPLKVRITISLDQDLVEHFKSEAEKPGALPYQTQINQALRRAIQFDGGESVTIEDIKASLLKDPGFISSIAKKINDIHPS